MKTGTRGSNVQKGTFGPLIPFFFLCRVSELMVYQTSDTPTNLHSKSKSLIVYIKDRTLINLKKG